MTQLEMLIEQRRNLLRDAWELITHPDRSSLYKQAAYLAKRIRELEDNQVKEQSSCKKDS